MFHIAAALFAQPVPEAPLLWEGIRAGTTATEARSLFPASERVRHADDRIVIDGERISDNCRADIHILHRGGSVEGVVLRGEPAIAGLCGDAILALVRSRHGEPARTERRRPFLRRARTTYMWSGNGLFLRYIHYAAGSGASAIADATNASWEMTVSTSAEPLQL